MSDPLEKLGRELGTSPVSCTTHPVAGILCDMYGLDEVGSSVKEVACLWLLHPRLGVREHMRTVADDVLGAWNGGLSSQRRGLIAVALDQRNHGSRLVHPQANEAWRSGNPRHAQDMFGIFQGTAADVSQLMAYLPAYAFPQGDRRIVDHVALGVSLGGYGVWQCLLHEPRISAGVVVVGCADYARVMTDRARLSKLTTYTGTTPPGKDFLGSSDFPPCLVEAVEKYDPTGIFLSPAVGPSADKDAILQVPSSEHQRDRLRQLMKKHLHGKRILNQAGAVDRLVPYTASEPFLAWLRQAVAPGGWYAGQGVVLEDKVYEGVGHAMSGDMLRDAVRFVVESVESQIAGSTAKM